MSGKQVVIDLTRKRRRGRVIEVPAKRMQLVFSTWSYLNDPKLIGRLQERQRKYRFLEQTGVRRRVLGRLENKPELREIVKDWFGFRDQILSISHGPPVEFFTPLLDWACSYRPIEDVKLLLEAGADPECCSYTFRHNVTWGDGRVWNDVKGSWPVPVLKGAFNSNHPKQFHILSLLHQHGAKLCTSFRLKWYRDRWITEMEPKATTIWVMWKWRVATAKTMRRVLMETPLALGGDAFFKKILNDVIMFYCSTSKYFE